MSAVAQRFSVNENSKILLRGREVKLLEDIKHGKLFSSLEENDEPEFLSNAKICALLKAGDLVIAQGFNDPARSRLRHLAPYLRDLDDATLLDISFKIEWATRYRQKRKLYGRIGDDVKMLAAMLEIQADFAREAVTAVKNSGLKEKYTYRDFETHLKLPSARAVRDWDLKLRLAGEDPRALLDQRGTGFRESKFDDLAKHIQGQFLLRFLSMTEPNAAYVFRMMEVYARLLNIVRRSAGLAKVDVGSRSTFYNRVNDLPDFTKFLARKGYKAASLRYFVVVGHERGNPMRVVEADECRIDLAVCFKLAKVWDKLSLEEQAAYEEVSKRVWCSAVIDHATTAFVSFRIHERAPSVDTALTTFLYTTVDKTFIARQAGCSKPWHHYGSFSEVRVDNAAWFDSARFHAVMNDAGAHNVYPPAAVPPLRGTIERIFQTLGSLTLQHFSGRTFSDIVRRGDHNAVEGASVDIQQLNLVFIRAIVDIFHHTPNKNKLGGLTPDRAWRIGSEENRIAAPPSGFLRRNVYGINITRVITREGIRFLGIRYQSDEIQDLRKEETGVDVRVRIDPMDLGEITVFVAGLAYRVPARNVQVKGINYWRWTAALQDLDAIDTMHTRRTQPDIDAALKYIDDQAEVARMAAQIGSPILTEKHLLLSDGRVRRPLQIVEESDYTRAVRAQDWSRTPFLDDGWGLSDPVAPDNYDIPSPAAQPVDAPVSKPSSPASDGNPEPDIYEEF